MDFKGYAAELLEKIKKVNPKICHMANYGYIKDSAFVISELGGRPLQVFGEGELEDIITMADALILETDSINNFPVEWQIKAGKVANKKGIPVILDPVWVGRTSFRTQMVETILKEVKISILKGNMDEISHLCGSMDKKAIKECAKANGYTIAVTGIEDFITDGLRSLEVKNGVTIMDKVMGIGIISSAVIGIFASMEKDFLYSTASALSCLGIAGEYAAQEIGVRGPASFGRVLKDQIYNLTSYKIIRNVDIKVIDI